MQRSTERILTTHVGSLARPHDLLEMMREREHGRPYDPAALDELITRAVADVVRRQAAAGLDVVTDGEQGKVSFLTYVKERLAGFDQVEGETLLPPSWQREIDDFPEYYQGYMSKYSSTVAPMRVMVCTGPVGYTGQAALAADVANLRAALADEQVAGKVTEAFLPSTSPSGFGRNEYYPTEHDYLVAVAEAMREEYLAIVEAGFLLQVDDPWLIEILTDDGHSDPAERRRRADEHVEVLNHALRGIPTEKIRLHTCYGLNHGPRLNDVPLREVAPVMLTDPRRRVLLRGRQPAPPARVADLAGPAASRASRAHPRPARPRDQLRRAPRADRRRHLRLRGPGRQGKRHRRRRLRLLLPRDVRARSASHRGVGQVRRARRGRRDRNKAPVGSLGPRPLPGIAVTRSFLLIRFAPYV